MKEHLISTIDGGFDHLVGEAMLDPINNTLVFDYIHGGSKTYYLPNVVSWTQQEYDADDDD